MSRLSLRALTLGVALTLAGAGTSTAQTVYLAFGDSVTRGSACPIDCSIVFDEEGLGGYPGRLETKLRDAGIDAEVRNEGIAGETTIEGLSRIEGVLRSSDDVAFLMEGTNDIGAGISTESILFNLGEMARKVRARGARPIYATVIPRPPFANRDVRNGATTGLARGLREQAFEEGRDLVDPFEVFITTQGAFNNLYFTGDSVGHPNAAGFEVLAQAFADVILDEDTVPPVVGRVLPNPFATSIPADTRLIVDLYDFGTGIDLSATSLLIGGVPVRTRVQGDENMATLRFIPEGDGLCGTVRLALETRDLADPPNVSVRSLAEFDIPGTNTLRVDVNDSCRVDGLDLIAFAFHFGARAGGARYNLSFDFDDDGDIDGDDLARLARRFGQTSS